MKLKIAEKLLYAFRTWYLVISKICLYVIENHVVNTIANLINQAKVEFEFVCQWTYLLSTLITNIKYEDAKYIFLLSRNIEQVLIESEDINYKINSVKLLSYLYKSNPNEPINEEILSELVLLLSNKDELVWYSALELICIIRLYNYNN